VHDYADEEQVALVGLGDAATREHVAQGKEEVP
jgi:hypothetical protein